MCVAQLTEEFLGLAVAVLDPEDVLGRGVRVVPQGDAGAKVRHVTNASRTVIVTVIDA